MLCSHLLPSSCNRCIHTLGSLCTLLHSVVSTQLHMHRHAVYAHTHTHIHKVTAINRVLLCTCAHSKNTDTHKYALAETHPNTHTPAAYPPPQPLVLMDGSLITTRTLGLLSPHLSPRTCVHVRVCMCVRVCLRERWG